MNVLILCEKPSAARNFSKALGGTSGKLDDGNDYKIVSAVGHIYNFGDIHRQVDSADAETFKKWSWATLPFDPDDFKWKKFQNSGVSDVVKKIKEGFKWADELVHACDVDPSGEGGMISGEIADNLGFKGIMSRAYFLDESAKEIKKAVNNRKKIDSLSTWDEYLKAEARQKWDFLSIGWTRAATLAVQDEGKRAVLRNGRLKSVMVYLVGQQLEAYNSYKKTFFYCTRFKDENGHIYKQKPKAEKRSDKKDSSLLTGYHDSDIVVDSREIKKSAPGKLLDLASLSAILSSRGYKPKSVLSVYQKMYQDNVVSYPRTEDRVITEEQYKELLANKDKIAKAVGVDSSLLTHTEPRKQHIGNGSHGANRPGSNIPASLDEVEEKYGKLGRAIYDILAKNTLVIFGEDYEYSHEKGHVKDFPDFVGSANVPVKMGFKAIFDAESQMKDKKDKDDDSEKDGGEGKPLGQTGKPFIHEGFNPRPAYPTIKWLVTRLEKYSVGTGSTRTSTISDITSESKTKLMDEKRGRLSMTYLGDVNYVLLDGTKIADVTVTENLFKMMDDVGKFKLSVDDVLKTVAPLLEYDIIKFKENAKKLKEAKNMAEYQPKEKVEGTYLPTGEVVKFNVEWGGHRFTDSEQTKLLAGEEISFEAVSKKGKDYTAVGSLKEGEFNGRKFWGFQLSPREPSIPDVFCQHEFTDDEKQKLLDGETIFVEDMISRKNKPFSANISYKDGKLDLSFG